jgi:hypothetical protein
MALIYESVKGSSLTKEEGDANILELDTRTSEKWQNEKGIIAVIGLSNPATFQPFKGIPVLNFLPDTISTATVFFHMPKDYVPGTDIYPHGHVLTDIASSGTVRWGFSITYANDYDAIDRLAGPPNTDQVFPDPVTTYVEHEVLTTYQFAHMIVEPTLPMSVPTLKPDSVLLMSVWRDGVHANDTYPDDIFLTSVDIYYRSQGFGEVDR